MARELWTVERDKAAAAVLAERCKVGRCRLNQVDP
jgi:hypothetical protein